MFAVVILGIGFIMVAAIFPVAIQQTQSNGEENEATLAARDAADAISALPGSIPNPRYDSSYTLPKPNATNGYTFVSPSTAYDAFKSVANFPVFPPTVKNNMLGTASGVQSTTPSGTLSAVAPPAVVVPFNGLRWQLLQSNSIQINDQRYAYVPFYRRENGSSSAELIVIAVAVRNKPQYSNSADVLNPYASNLAASITRNAIQQSSGGAANQAVPPASGLTVVNPDTISISGAYEGLAAQLSSVPGSYVASGYLLNRTYTLGRNVGNNLFEINPGDVVALAADGAGNWGGYASYSGAVGHQTLATAAIADFPGPQDNGNLTTAVTTNVQVNVFKPVTLQPTVAYAELSSTPSNPAGEITLYTASTGFSVPPAAVPGAFVIVADDFPFDPSNPNGGAIPGSNAYGILPNFTPLQGSNIAPYAVGAMNGRIFRLSTVATDFSANGLKRFNLDPSYGMRPAGNYVESPDTMPGQSILAAAQAASSALPSGVSPAPYDPSQGTEQFRIKVYIVGAPLQGTTPIGSAQDIGVFATYFQVK